jgi:hypothetical protein
MKPPHVVPKFTPRSVQWSSLELLEGIGAEDISANSEQRESVRDELWGDLCAEHDAEYFWTYLNAGDHSFSAAFQSVVSVWRSDERNHYLGLRRICSLVYGLTEEEIDRRMAEREVNFIPMHHLLADEFRICVVAAYDELVSARGYKRFAGEFKAFGRPEFVTLIKRAARDEALHYQNFLDVLRFAHAGRLNEVAGVVDEICAYEARRDLEYSATFILDHFDDTFSRGFLADCGQTVVKRINQYSAAITKREVANAI